MPVDGWPLKLFFPSPRRNLFMRFSHLLVSCGLTFATSSFAWTSWVGVLEDWPLNQDVSPIEKGTRRPEMKYESRIRPLFIRVDQQIWQAAPRPGDANPQAALPKAFSWDVCFTGRSEGQITGMLIADGIPTTAPPYVLRPEDRAPWRTRRSLDYAGWLPIPVYKPILLLSSLSSSCKDPEKWRRAGSEKIRNHTPKMLSELRKALSAGTPGTEGYQFADKDFKVFQAWVSPKHGQFAAMRIDPKANRVETFQVAANGDVAYLGHNMMLVDAGDFDGDGATELLFKRHANKKDVYSLFVKGAMVAESIWDYP
jgi:hypothetical protein